ncbi:MAG: hypothetical protein RLZZ15_3346, partial [Verrucomicrobiota bacterium]
ALAAFWVNEQLTTISLREEIDLRRHERGEMEALRKERERLERFRHEAALSAKKRTETSEGGRPRSELVSPAQPTPRPPATELSVGEWLPPSAWRNRGSLTPTAAVETTLWAAAGGDLTTLKNLFRLDDAVRAKADAIRAQLPENSRALYPSAEHLIAAFTTKSIPLSEAQLVWHQQNGTDDAVACVFLQQPDVSAISPVPPAPSSTGDIDNPPPMAPPNPPRSAG